MRTAVNLSGGNGWQWNPPSSDWLAQHFRDHYAFSGDIAYLAETAWAILRDVSGFRHDHLVETDDIRETLVQPYADEIPP